MKVIKNLIILCIAVPFYANAQSELPDFNALQDKLNKSFKEETATVTVDAKEQQKVQDVKEQSAPPPVQKIENESPKPYIDDNVVNIATGSITGVYYPLGSSICRLLNRNQEKGALKCGVESTEGSVQNIGALAKAEVDFGIVQSDWLENAYKGTSIFQQNGAYENLRYVFAFFTESMTFLARTDSKIIGVDDFKGKIMNIGPSGSGLRATLFEMFKAKKWQRSDFKSLLQLSPYEQIDALCNGNLDIMVLATGHPNGIVQEATKTCDAEIVNIVDPAITLMINGNNEYAKSVIPGGLYFGNPNDKVTFGVPAVLVTTNDMSEDIVYEVTKAVFENLEEFKRLHPVFASLKIENMVSIGMTAPMHAGARKYFIEKGYIQ